MHRNVGLGRVTKGGIDWKVFQKKRGGGGDRLEKITVGGQNEKEPQDKQEGSSSQLILFQNSRNQQPMFEQIKMCIEE